jgi:hypothetical protein
VQLHLEACGKLILDDAFGEPGGMVIISIQPSCEI